MKSLEDRVLIGFVILASLAMTWVVLPFFGAILWALIAAIVFAPVNSRIQRLMPTHRNSAASLTLLIIVGIVIVPAVMVGTLVVDEAVTIYGKVSSRQIDLTLTLDQVKAALPEWAGNALARADMGDLDELRDRVASAVTSGLRIAAEKAVSIGQSTFGFFMSLGVMLYLTYFLLRDGAHLMRRIGSHVPMRAPERARLFNKFATVIRATIRGSIVVAIVQGMLGGIIFRLLGIDGALLWGVVMGLLSLIPAIGTGLVWVPVASYLLIVGDIQSGVILLLCGFFIISMVDNVLRPILVGADTRIPDWVILVTTLGGIATMGINGFVVGPVVAALFIASWELLAEQRAADEAES